MGAVAALECVRSMLVQFIERRIARYLGFPVPPQQWSSRIEELEAACGSLAPPVFAGHRHIPTTANILLHRQRQSLKLRQVAYLGFYVFFCFFTIASTFLAYDIRIGQIISPVIKDQMQALRVALVEMLVVWALCFVLRILCGFSIDANFLAYASSKTQPVPALPVPVPVHASSRTSPNASPNASSKLRSWVPCSEPLS